MEVYFIKGTSYNGCDGESEQIWLQLHELDKRYTDGIITLDEYFKQDLILSRKLDELIEECGFE